MKTIAAVGAIAVALVLGHGALAQTPTDPEGVFRAAIEAFNAGDAAAAAAFFSEDTTVTGLCPPANVCHGRAEVQAQLEEEIAHGAQDEIRSIAVNGDTAVIELTETAPGFAELGIERIYINITAVVQDGLITSMTDELDLTDAQTATFAQAMEGEEQSSLPTSGTGNSPPSAGAPWWVLAGLMTIGAGSLAAGWKVRGRV